MCIYLEINPINPVTALPRPPNSNSKLSQAIVGVDLAKLYMLAMIRMNVIKNHTILILVHCSKSYNYDTKLIMGKMKIQLLIKHE